MWGGFFYFLKEEKYYLNQLMPKDTSSSYLYLVQIEINLTMKGKIDLLPPMDCEPRQPWVDGLSSELSRLAHFHPGCSNPATKHVFAVN